MNAKQRYYDFHEEEVAIRNNGQGHSGVIQNALQVEEFNQFSARLLLKHVLLMNACLRSYSLKLKNSNIETNYVSSISTVEIGKEIRLAVLTISKHRLRYFVHKHRNIRHTTIDNCILK